MLPRCSFLPVVSDWIISLSAKSHRFQNSTGSIARVSAGMENKSVGLKTGVDVNAVGRFYVLLQLCLCLTFHINPFDAPSC